MGDDSTRTRSTPGPAPRGIRGAVRDLAVLGVVGILLGAALVAGGSTLYRSLYSPTAFVEQYLADLSAGRAADALALPGVALDAGGRAGAGIPAEASDALLRQAALGDLTDIRVVSEIFEGDVATVRAEYRAGGHSGATEFRVARDGWIGVSPTWRFARSPLAVVGLSVLGTMRFTVNGFDLDKRQVSADGADADPAARIPLLVFSPGLYSIAVDTAIATSPGVAVLSDMPGKNVPVTVQAQPTPEFVDTVAHRVTEFLTNCATQQVLQPSGCPFGYVIRNRIADLPEWSIVSQPTIALEPDGNAWRITPAPATAHIRVDVRSLFDGRIREVDDDVPFTVTGTVTVEADGAATITVTTPSG